MTQRIGHDHQAAPAYQHARFALRIGQAGGIGADVAVTSGGLLSIGALVSAILLSTAVLVRVSVREGKRAGRR